MSESKNDEYCKKYKGNDTDFIDCCITLFPALDDEEASEQIKYDLCERLNNKCQEYTCLMDTDDLLLSDGKLNKEAIITKFMSDKSDDVWLPVVQQVYNNCFKAAEGSDCIPMTFGKCFEALTFLQCPASEWNNTESCNEARRFAQTCYLKI